MKALLLSTDYLSIQDQRFLTGFRQQIGTCEFYSLSKDQQNNVEQFFADFIRLSQFDRIVLEFSQSLIKKESMFLRQLPHLAILAIGDKLSKDDRRLLKNNLYVMPWMRIISDDHQLVSELLNDGYDAAWLRPMYNPDFYHSRRHKRQKPKCIVFDETGEVLSAIKQYYPQLDIDICQKMKDIAKAVKAGDVFIYWPQDLEQIPRAMIYAMACGATVITPKSDSDALHYQWRDQKNCIFASDAYTAVEQFTILQSHTKVLYNVAKKALEHAQFFTLEKVGGMLGSKLMPAMRNPKNYPKKVRVFGFEF